MNIAIVYSSTHHGNTKKLIDEMISGTEVAFIDATKVGDADLGAYDLIGFASGIYMGKFCNSILDYIERTEFKAGQKVFFVFTCGAMGRYAKKLTKTVFAKGAKAVGTFGCRGYDTYGFWGKIGGIAKNRPNTQDFANAQTFFANLSKQ